MKRSQIITACVIGLICTGTVAGCAYEYLAGEKKEGDAQAISKFVQTANMDSSLFKTQIQTEYAPSEVAEDDANEDLNVDLDDEKRVHDLITGEDQSVVKEYVADKYGFNTAAVNQRSAQLQVSHISQLPNLPTGCEITSLTTVLNYYGYAVSKETMADDYLPKCAFGTGSFRDYFIGNPRDENSFGCYARPIVSAASNYFSSHGSRHQVSNYSGSDFSVLLNQVAEGKPVVMWITISLLPAYKTYEWNINGRNERWIAPEHCVVLTGYDLDAQTVTISDPLKGIEKYNMRTVACRYNQMEQQAVVVSPVVEQTQEPPTEATTEAPTEPTTPAPTKETVEPPTDAPQPEPTPQPAPTPQPTPQPNSTPQSQIESTTKDKSEPYKQLAKPATT